MITDTCEMCELHEPASALLRTLARYSAIGMRILQNSHGLLETTLHVIVKGKDRLLFEHQSTRRRRI